MTQRVTLLLALFLILLLPAAVTAQGTPITYERYDVEIAIQSDGSFHVREIQQVRFHEDGFRTAFAQIPRAYTTSIENIFLGEPGRPYERVPGEPNVPGQFVSGIAGNEVEVLWQYEPVVANEVKTFILEYDVIGGLWVYPDGDVLEWRAVPADRSGVPVAASTVTVTLPSPVEPAALESNAFGPPYETDTTPGKVTFTATASVPDGTAFQVMVGFPHDLVAASVQPWQRAEDSANLVYTIPQLDVHLEILEDGRVRVTEQQRVRVEEGTLYTGQRVLPLLYVDGVEEVALWEGEQAFTQAAQAECEYCFTITETTPGTWARNGFEGELTIDEGQAGSARIVWTVPPLVKGEETTFTLAYTLRGALRILEDGQLLLWDAGGGFPVIVDNVDATVSLPPGVTPAGAEVGVARGMESDVGTAAPASVGEAGTARLHEAQLRPGESWPLRVRLPAGATQASTPAWQQELERVVQRGLDRQEAIRQQEMRRARLQLLLAAGALLLFAGGFVGVMLLWYLFGRDELAPELPLTLTEPPSALAPAIVAYLLDEKPTTKGVLASLFHLARVGLVQIDLEEPIRLRRNYDGTVAPGQTIQTPAGDEVRIAPHLAELFNRLRDDLPTDKSVLLDNVAHSLPAIIPNVYARMAEEVAHFFDRQPGRDRHRWLVVGQWIVLGGALAAITAGVTLAGDLGWVALAPTLAIVLVGIALIIVSRWMPRRSDQGVLEAARWRAFERYLRDLKGYGGLAEAQEILERYFSYAIALDVEDIVLKQAVEMGTQMPAWTRPVVVRGPHRPDYPRKQQTRPAAEPTPPGPLRAEPRREGVPTPLPGGDRRIPQALPRDPSLERLSERITRSLNRADRSLTDLLNRAVGKPEDTPFRLVYRGAKGATRLSWAATKTTASIMEDILENAASSSSSSYGGGGFSSRSSSFGSSRSSFSSRSSGSRRSGGGGSRGFGR